MAAHQRSTGCATNLPPQLLLRSHLLSLHRPLPTKPRALVRHGHPAPSSASPLRHRCSSPPLPRHCSRRNADRGRTGERGDPSARWRRSLSRPLGATGSAATHRSGVVPSHMPRQVWEVFPLPAHPRGHPPRPDRPHGLLPRGLAVQVRQPPLHALMADLEIYMY